MAAPAATTALDSVSAQAIGQDAGELVSRAIWIVLGGLWIVFLRDVSSVENLARDVVGPGHAENGAGHRDACRGDEHVHQRDENMAERGDLS